ncbi:TetR/AcrR family transcriptional regulator [Fictibacillus phosphorivorans]|uniref:TetR/AcrR family transcriptional regulator n=1 Tax=Fictibacillus phosphorivorans TaxID=1221500 RepID=UPI00203EFDEC|nr:TetR/AcrR family transcriptional regulator [Fictibacillus phosphorivorans]MCM3719000.1 TetR/AcrR family transcriptional regulator [Fictibacillus phosphorivorans]MCM3776622.1 TetR/AcrR family transcriptional regulator [Fictibacillus phosphorivorans]
MGRKKRTSYEDILDKNKILETAIDLINTEGLQKLSMRNVATSLNTSAASLYWHIKNKQELMQLLSEEIVKKIPYPDAAKSWDEQIIEFGKGYRSALFAIRDSVEIMTETIPMTAERLKLIEYIYQVLLKAGVKAAEVPAAAGLIHNYVLSFVKDEMALLEMAKAEGISTEKRMQEVSEMFKALDKSEFPALVELAEHSVSIHGVDAFEMGLSILLSGIRERIEKGLT